MFYYCVHLLVCLLLSFFFFFFKQKTAYEMRISDWSSDVCSSDLRAGASQCKKTAATPIVGTEVAPMGRSYNMHRVRCEVPGEDPARRRGIDGSRVSAGVQPSALIALGTGQQTTADRKSDVGGTRVEVGEDLGGLRVI